MTADQSIIDIIAPKGVLRVAINLANFLLVSGTPVDGTPDWMLPDIARRIAAALSVPCEFVLFDGPGQLADSVDNDLWDIGNIAIEQVRAQTINFSNPYLQIDANFMIRRDAPLTDNEAINMAAINNLGMAEKAEPWGSKITKR
jgi:polar amino acid transport system substrate-binding protein